MYWYDESGSESSENSEIDKVREVSRQLPPGWAPKQVLNSSCHRKKCTECGGGWCEGEWYFTDVSCPWGAEKICMGCIDSWLIDNGIQESCSEDEFGEGTDEEEDECDDEIFASFGQGVRPPRPVAKPENNSIKTETENVKCEAPADQEQTVKTEDQKIKIETVDLEKKEQSDIKVKNEIKNEGEQSEVKTENIKETIVKQEVENVEQNSDQILGVKRELDVVEEKNLTVKKIKTE